MMLTQFSIHGAGNRIAVKQGVGSETLWLSIPLSDDEHATDVTAFLAPEDCDRLARDLTAAAERVRRMRAVRDEMLAASA